MRIGLLSICAMMFLLYGTDCRADRDVEDSEALRAVEEEAFIPVSDMNRKTRKRERFINKKQNSAIKKVNLQESMNVENIKDRQDESKMSEFGKSADPVTPARQSPWFRDKRSFADVVKGVKKEDENVQKQPTESEEQFHDAIDFENNVWLEEKNRNEKNSVKFEQPKEPAVSDDQIKSEEKQVVEENKVAPPQVRRSKKAYGTEMTKNQRAARSKKAFDARRSRERQRKKFTDEVRKN
ncbi:MAG: hypothetical protein K5766_03775 [Alphaproteobacteria bacterium]|nr:hypothetical protein [Alphaproteobacteria bacterium]